MLVTMEEGRSSEDSLDGVDLVQTRLSALNIDDWRRQEVQGKVAGNPGVVTAALTTTPPPGVVTVNMQHKDGVISTVLHGASPTAENEDDDDDDDDEEFIWHLVGTGCCLESQTPHRVFDGELGEEACMYKCEHEHYHVCAYVTVRNDNKWCSIHVDPGDCNVLDDTCRSMASGGKNFQTWRLEDDEEDAAEGVQKAEELPDGENEREWDDEEDDEDEDDDEEEEKREL